MSVRRFALALAAGALLLSPALAHDFKVGEVKIDHPWARATPGQARNGAAYFKLETTAAAADRLLRAESPVAGKVELHTHINDNGVMRMREVPAIEVKPGVTTTLAPSGLHVMLLGLKAPLKQGETFPLTLVFERAGSVTVTVNVEAPGAAGGHHSH